MKINKRYELPFAVEAVYANWLSSKTIIAPATSMDILAKVGGHYRLIMDSNEFRSINEGRFLIVEPNCHVRYTWEWNNDGEVSEIDVTFSTSENGTVVYIEHSGFQNQQSVVNRDLGWDHYIQGFESFMSKHAD